MCGIIRAFIRNMRKLGNDASLSKRNGKLKIYPRGHISHASATKVYVTLKNIEPHASSGADITVDGNPAERNVEKSITFHDPVTDDPNDCIDTLYKIV